MTTSTVLVVCISTTFLITNKRVGGGKPITGEKKKKVFWVCLCVEW